MNSLNVFVFDNWQRAEPYKMIFAIKANRNKPIKELRSMAKLNVTSFFFSFFLYSVLVLVLSRRKTISER